MPRKIHIDNLMRARLKKMVAAAMPEYEEVQKENRALAALVRRSIVVIESGGDTGAYLADAKLALSRNTTG